MKDLEVDTPCIVWNGSAPSYDVSIRFYNGKGSCFAFGKKSNDIPLTLEGLSVCKWDHIIPVDKFDFKTFTFDENDDYGMKIDKDKIYEKFI